MNKPHHPYRTVFIASLGIAALLAGLMACAFKPEANAAYPAFVGGIGVCVSAVAAKAFGEHKVKAEAAAASAVPVSQ